MLLIFQAFNLSNTHNDNWKNKLIQQNKEYRDAINNLNTSPSMKKFFKESIIRNKELLKNDIDPSINNFSSFIINQFDISLIMSIAIVYYIISQSNNTFELSYSTDISRVSLFIQSVCFDVGVAICYTVFIYIITWVIAIFFWYESAISSIKTFKLLNEGKSFYLYSIMLLLLKLIEFISYSIIISSLKKLPIKKIMKILIFILLFFGTFFLPNDISQSVNKYAFSTNMDLTIFMKENLKINNLTLMGSIVKFLVYDFIIFIISLFFYKSKDIVN